MERKERRRLIKKYRLLLECARIVCAWWIFLLIAKYSKVYETGIIPGDVWSAWIIGITFIYHFLSIAFVPAILVAWLLKAVVKP